MKINKNLAILLLLFIIILINYINIFPNEFAWDDEFFVVNNIHIRELKNIPGFFTEPSPGSLYRPLRSTFYTINYQIWHLNVFGYHLNSLILHFLVTVLIFLITINITKKTTFSFVVSLLFAAHPIHTERVTNITGSYDIYGILFMLLSLFFYIIYIKNKKNNYYIFSIISYLLALFSTEEAITLILILFLYDFSFNYKLNIKNIKLLIKKYVPYIAITILYLIIRFSVLNQIGRGEGYFHHSFFSTILTTMKIFVMYIISLFFPFKLVIEHYVKFETSLLSPGFIIPFIVLLSVLFLFIKTYKMSEFSKKNSEHAQTPLVFDKSKLLFFSIGWFLITLLPFSNIFPQVTIMADRYLYLPSYGFCLFLTYLIFKINKINFTRKIENFPLFNKLFHNLLTIKKYSKTIIIILIILITGMFTFLTIQRNTEWKDSFTLYTKDLEKNPLGTKPNEGLALEYKRAGDYDNAIKYASRAIKLSKENYKAYEIIGTSYAYKKDYEKAIFFYKFTLELRNDYYLANNNLGLVYSYIKDFNNSVYYLKRAIESNPNLAKAHHDIATIYAKIEEFELADEEFKKAIEINPYEEEYKKNYKVFRDFLVKNKISLNNS